VVLSTGVARLALEATANATDCRARLAVLTAREGYEPAPTGVSVPKEATCVAWRAFSDARCVDTATSPCGRQQPPRPPARVSRRVNGLARKPTRAAAQGGLEKG
jgi:hypothetical protein